MPQVQVSHLAIYPVKSCSQIMLKNSSLTDWGLEHDRCFMLVDKQGDMITQRTHPQLSKLTINLESDHVLIHIPQQESEKISLVVEGPIRNVDCWGDECRAFDCGDAIAAKCSALLGEDVRLVRMDPQFKRMVESLPGIAPSITGFSDGFPILLISEASLADLNARLTDPVPMLRFRPNIVVSGCEAFAEDSWKRLRIGAVEFEVVKPCARCVFTCVDQETGERGSEPLKTLASYRRQEGGVMFGMNVVHRAKGVISVGDGVEVLD